MMALRVWHARRKFERDLAARQRSCHWHFHSLFYQCPNGLTASGYRDLLVLERLCLDIPPKED